jgi:leucyl/phenylalanyl-tRNA--protein transferase
VCRCLGACIDLRQRDLAGRHVVPPGRDRLRAREAPVYTAGPMARALPVYLAADAPVRFPDPARADAEGLVAVGGDLSAPRLLAAYRAGIFPWFDERMPPLWWSPDPRAVITPASLHVARRLARTLRSGRFTVTWDAAFAEVMRACGEDRSDGTWITSDMRVAYGELHARGHAHSVEVWQGEELAGGIYGVHVGAVFAAESMFHRRTDASKVALVALARRLFAAGVECMEVQFLTPHLRRLGAVEIPRPGYLALLHGGRDRTIDLGTRGPFPLPAL